MANMVQVEIPVQEIKSNDYISLWGTLYRVFSAGPNRDRSNNTNLQLMDDRIMGIHASDIVEVYVKNDTLIQVLRPKNTLGEAGWFYRGM